MTPTPEQVLERLAYLQELREKRAALRAKGKHDLGLSQAINDIDQEVCEWPAEMLQRAVATLRQQATALAEAQEREARLREAIGVYITHVYACLGIDDDKMVATFAEALKGATHDD